MLNALSLTVLFCAASVAVVALRLLRHLRFSPGTLRLFLVLTSLPWLAHYWVTRRYCAGWGCDDPDVVPARGLELFAYVSPSIVLALFIVFFALAPRWPRSIVLFPLIAASAELVSLLVLHWRAPSDYVYMNAAADRWLVVSSLAASFFLASCSWFRSGSLPGSAQ